MPHGSGTDGPRWRVALLAQVAGEDEGDSPARDEALPDDEDLPVRPGAFGWTVPSEEEFRFHLAQVRELGGYLFGRRLYETMLVWETDPSLRGRTLGSVQGNARLAGAPVADEVAATGKDVSIGGAGLAAAAIGLGLVDELRMFRNPVVVVGTPFLPPVTGHVQLDLVETRTLGSRVIYERYARPR